MKYAVAIDIGGTNTRVALIDENYSIVERFNFKTSTEDPYPTCENIRKIVEGFKEEIIGVGLSCPGPLDLIKGKILEPPNLRGKWRNFNISSYLSDLLKTPVYLENDANLAALAEAIVGRGKNKRIVQYLTISTGIGAGLVIDKKIFLGAHGFANEIANMCMWKDGPQHGSIYPGGIEAISSGSALVSRAQKQNLDVKHAGMVNDLAIKGNTEAIKIIEEGKEYLANAIAAIIAFIDPDIVVLGGSVALKIDGFVKDIKDRVKSRVYECVKDHVNIVASDFNDDGGLIGGACLAFNKTRG